MDEIWINTRGFFSFLEMKTPRGVVKQPERSGPTVYWSVYKATQLKSGCIYFSRSWRWLWMEHWKPLTLFFCIWKQRERKRESSCGKSVSAFKNKNVLKSQTLGPAMPQGSTRSSSLRFPQHHTPFSLLRGGQNKKTNSQVSSLFVKDLSEDLLFIQHEEEKVEEMIYTWQTMREPIRSRRHAVQVRRRSFRDGWPPVLDMRIHKRSDVSWQPASDCVAFGYGCKHCLCQALWGVALVALMVDWCERLEVR